MHQITINVLTARSEIFKALVESQDSSSIIGISSEELGSGTYMTSVKEIIMEDEDDCIVVLNSYDASGYFLEKNKIRLTSINCVIPFHGIFENPFLKAIRKEPASAGNKQNQDYIF